MVHRHPTVLATPPGRRDNVWRHHGCLHSGAPQAYDRRNDNPFRTGQSGLGFGGSRPYCGRPKWRNPPQKVTISP